MLIKNHIFGEKRKLPGLQSSNGMQSSDFCKRLRLFCLLRSYVYVQRQQSGANRVQKPHFTVFPSNFITAHKAKVQQCYKKLFKTSLKDSLGKIFRVFEICALNCWCVGVPISSHLVHFGVWLKCLTASAFHILDVFEDPWTGRSQGGEFLFPA